MVQWSEEAIERLYGAARAGETIEAVATALGLMAKDVAAKAARLRIKWPSPDPDRPGTPISPPEPARVAPAKARDDDSIPAWSDPASDAVIARHTAMGWSAARIGDLFGVSRNAVIGRCERRGIALGGQSAAARSERPAPKPRVAAAKPAPDRVRPIVIPRPMPRIDRDDRPRSDPGRPDPALSVRFLDRRDGACAAILDDTAPILERRCCGAPVSGLHFQFCAHHRLRYTTRPVRASA